MVGSLHPAAPHALPFFLPGVDGTDTLLTVMAVFLVVTVVIVGVLFLRLHT